MIKMRNSLKNFQKRMIMTINITKVMKKIKLKKMIQQKVIEKIKTKRRDYLEISTKEN